MGNLEVPQELQNIDTLSSHLATGFLITIVVIVLFFVVRDQKRKKAGPVADNAAQPAQNISAGQRVRRTGLFTFVLIITIISGITSIFGGEMVIGSITAPEGVGQVAAMFIGLPLLVISITIFAIALWRTIVIYKRSK